MNANYDTYRHGLIRLALAFSFAGKSIVLTLVQQYLLPAGINLRLRVRIIALVESVERG